MDRNAHEGGASKASRWVVSGRVQGVGFRAFVVRTARQLGLAGYVRNLVDGSVEIYAEGPSEALERLSAAVQRGPAHAHVSASERSDAVPTGAFTAFEVRW